MATSVKAQLPGVGDLVDDGKYRIDAQLGQGGMGVVYGATHTVLGVGFAIKWLLPRLAEDAGAVERFLREAKLAARVQHPNIVRIIDVSTKAAAPFIVMELLDGDSLAHHLAQRTMSVGEAGNLMMPILHAVAAAHAAGVIHRDLKPENVVLCNVGGSLMPKVLDFGIAKAADNAGTKHSLTQNNMVLGTLQYMSPEQLKQSNSVTVQTDVYALGVMLYRMVSGAFPHPGDNIFDLALRVREGVPMPLSAHVRDLPDGLEAVIHKAIAASTAERYPDVRTFALALERYFPSRFDWGTSPGRVNGLGAAVAQPGPSLATSQGGSLLLAAPGELSSLHALEMDSRRPGRRSVWGWLLAACIPLAAGAAWYFMRPPASITPPPVTAAPPPATPPTAGWTDPTPEPKPVGSEATPVTGAPAGGAAKPPAAAAKPAGQTSEKGGGWVIVTEADEPKLPDTLQGVIATPTPPPQPVLSVPKTDRRRVRRDRSDDRETTRRRPPPPDEPAAAPVAAPQPAAASERTPPFNRSGPLTKDDF